MSDARSLAPLLCNACFTAACPCVFTSVERRVSLTASISLWYWSSADLTIDSSSMSSIISCHRLRKDFQRSESFLEKVSYSFMIFFHRIIGSSFSSMRRPYSTSRYGAQFSFLS